MTTGAIEVAEMFRRISGRYKHTMRPVKLMKLVYLAHAYKLALCESPLIEDEILAYKFGVYIPKLHERLKLHGNRVVKESLAKRLFIDQPSHEIIMIVKEQFIQYSGSYLSSLTRKPDDPWGMSYVQGQMNLIPDKLIRSYYSNLIKVNDEQETGSYID